jgi:hypothetical protein
VNEHNFSSILEPEILKEAGVENDGHSWIAAKIQVRHSIAVQLYISPPLILCPSWC